MLIKTASFPLQESLVLLNPDRERLHLLNPFAKSVYQALEIGLHPYEIAEEIAENRKGQRCSIRGIRSELDILFDQWHRQGLTLKSGRIYRKSANLFQKEKKCSEEKSSCETLYNEQVFRLHDLSFAIQWAGPSEIWSRILALYGHLREGAGGNNAETLFSVVYEQGKYILYQDNQRINAFESCEQAVLALDAEIGELWHQRRDGLFIAHAAGVARKKSCFLLPAKGGSGKSTLTAALVKEDFSFLSDEVVPVLRETGHAVAHPLCMRIKQGSLDALRSMYPELDGLQQYPWGITTLRFLPPPRFQRLATEKTWPVAQIIFPQYQEDVETVLQEISPVEALQGMIEAGCILKTPLHPETVAELVDWIQQRPAYTLRYSCLHDALRVLRELPDGL